MSIVERFRSLQCSRNLRWERWTLHRNVRQCMCLWLVIFFWRLFKSMTLPVYCRISSCERFSNCLKLKYFPFICLWFHGIYGNSDYVPSKSKAYTSTNITALLLRNRSQKSDVRIVYTEAEISACNTICMTTIKLERYEDFDV